MSSRCFKLTDITARDVSANTTTGLDASYLIDWAEGRGPAPSPGPAPAPVREAHRLRITCQVYTPGGNHSLHQHESIEQAYYILSGKGKLYIGDETWDVGPGMVAYIPPKTDHRIQNTGDDELVHLLINVNLA